ncbi:Fic family protein [Chitinophaga silvisoli]|uniref:Fic family protein n=1 Tax=Chitinophaga silvisoli TaxID=2291814 RepID=A0A3E1NSS9_9BACT|nr:Fic family protein [Chitinophaga silvisoli]RFM30991.1 Fic family protein [Chitinophaga silvisoli]
MKYNWQQAGWPEFSYSTTSEIEYSLYEFAEKTGYVTGMLDSIPVDLQEEVVIQTMVAEALKTSAIEGEFLSRQDVISSIRHKLGLPTPQHSLKDLRAAGAGELMVAVRNTYQQKLTKETLFEWHCLLMQGSSHINIGAWRKGTAPMQVISGSFGKETVHFEAPPSAIVSKEMTQFIRWFNDTAPGQKKAIRNPAIRSAIAHLYFESIHPFEDGNGRIGRAIAEKALSQTIGRPVLLSISRTIEANKNAYYQHLKSAQKGNEITEWINYFVDTILKAQLEAKQLVVFTLKKTKFMDVLRDKMNERQTKAILKMLDAGPEGFEGGMTAKKYMSITKASKATATRDLQDLVEIGALMYTGGGGRSTHYTLVI